MPEQVAQLTLAQFYYFKNIAWYYTCANSNIEVKVLDQAFSGNLYINKKRKYSIGLVRDQEWAIQELIKEGKKPTIKLIREKMANKG